MRFLHQALFTLYVYVATVCLTLLHLPLFLLHAHHRIHMTIQVNVGTAAILSVKQKKAEGAFT